MSRINGQADTRVLHGHAPVPHNSQRRHRLAAPGSSALPATTHHPATGMALTSDRPLSFRQAFTKRVSSLVRAGLCWITGMDDGSRRRLARRPRLPVHLMFADSAANRELYGDRFIDDMNRDRDRDRIS